MKSFLKSLENKADAGKWKVCHREVSMSYLKDMKEKVIFFKTGKRPIGWTSQPKEKYHPEKERKVKDETTAGLCQKTKKNLT